MFWLKCSIGCLFFVAVFIFISNPKEKNELVLNWASVTANNDYVLEK